MKTRISKHGKYEIREGLANEVGDSLEPGDILIVHDTEGEPPVKTRVVKCLTDMNVLDGIRSVLSAETFVCLGLTLLTNPQYFDMHPYLVRIVSTGEYIIWIAEATDEATVKIKHPLYHDEPISADKVEADTITVKKVVFGNLLKTVTEPDLYQDRRGDVLRVFRDEKYRLRYVYITLGDELTIPDTANAGFAVELAVHGPFTRITSIEQLREVLNKEVAE